MLNHARLVRSRAAACVVQSGLIRSVGSSLINRSNLIVRYQHSESISKPNEATTIDPEEKKKSLAARKEQYEIIRARKINELTAIATRYDEIHDKNLKNDYGKIFDELVGELETFDVRDRGMFTTRKMFTPIIDRFVRLAYEENDPHFSPEYIVFKLSELKVCDVKHYGVLSKAKYIEGDLSGVLNVWVTCLEYKSSSNIKARTLDNMKMCTQLAYIENCLNEGTTPNLEVLRAILQEEEFVNPSYIYSSIRRFLEGQPERIEKLIKAIDEVQLSKEDPNSFKFASNAEKSAMAGNVKALDNVYEQVLKCSKLRGIAIDEQTLVSFMYFYNIVNQRFRVMEIWNEIMKSGIIPSTGAWNELLESVSKFGKYEERVERIESIFEQIPEKNEDTYAKMIQLYSRLKRSEKVEELITPKRLKNPSIIRAYIQHLSSLNELDKMEQVFNEYRKINPSISIQTYNNLLYGFTKNKDLTKASELLKIMADNNVKPDVATYSIILDITLKTTRKRGDIVDEGLIGDLIDDMRKNGIQINGFTVATLIDGLGKDPSYTNTAIELFKYLEKHNFTNHVTFVSMISNMFAVGKIDKAEEYIGKMAKKGHQLSTKHWNGFFAGFAKNSRSDKVKEYYNVFRSTGANNSYPDVNKFTFYYLLKAALYGKDFEFANLIFKDMEECNFTGISDETRVIIKKLKERDPQGVEIPKFVQDQL